MIGKLNHVAIVVPDLAAAIKIYQDIFAVEVTEVIDLPEHGVSTVFVKLPNCKIELLHPLGNKSPIANFLAKHADGAIHHICYEVNDLTLACEKLTQQGLRILGDGTPKIGAHGKPVIFLHPKDSAGTLIELKQV